MESLDNELNQEEILKRLTGGYTTEGLYIQNGHLYINGSAIRAGSISGDRVSGGVLKFNVGKENEILLGEGVVKTVGTSKTGAVFKSNNSADIGISSSGGNIVITNGSFAISFLSTGSLRVQAGDGSSPTKIDNFVLDANGDFIIQDSSMNVQIMSDSGELRIKCDSTDRRAEYCQWRYLQGFGMVLVQK